MRNPLTSQSLRYHAPVLVCLLAIVFLIFLPTGFEGALLYQEAERGGQLHHRGHRPGALRGAAL